MGTQAKIWDAISVVEGQISWDPLYDRKSLGLEVAVLIS
jgi:hypothetical protein